MHVIAAKAVCFKEALSEEFQTYAKNVAENAQALAKGLMDRGFDLVSGGTDNHLMLVDLRSKNITGKEFEIALDAANINKDFEDLSEVYLFCEMIDENKDGDPDVGKGFAKIGYKISALDFSDYFVVNASGKVTDSKARNKDGNDFVYAVTGNGDIAAVYVED